MLNEAKWEESLSASLPPLRPYPSFKDILDNSNLIILILFFELMVEVILFQLLEIELTLKTAQTQLMCNCVPQRPCT